MAKTPKGEHDSSIVRFAQILMKLNNGESFTTSELAAEFNVGARTIQRDMKYLSVLPIACKNRRYYLEPYALGKLSFGDVCSFATLSGIKSLYPNLDKKFIVDLLNPSTNEAFLVKNQGFEDVRASYEAFEKMSAAIVGKWEASFVYSGKTRRARPYKLVSNDGVWYLLAQEGGRLKNFAFSKIKDFKADEKSTFEPDPALLDIIAQEGNKWASSELKEVTLHIAPEAVGYYKRRPAFPAGRVVSDDESGLIVQTSAAYDDEILNIVKRWIPYMRITSPASLHEKLKKILEDYIKEM